MTDDERDRLYSEVGRRVRSIRKGRKLSQEALAVSVGISRASIVNIEKGRQHPPLHVLWEIAERLGAEPYELIPKRRDFHFGAEDSEIPPDFVARLRKLGVEDPRVVRSVAGLANAPQRSEKP